MAMDSRGSEAPDRIPTPPPPGGCEALAALAAYLAATLLYLIPFVGDPRGSLGPDLGDPRLNLYLLQWGAHQISLGLPDLWNAPFFHPTAGTLAISDHLLGPAAVTWALGALGVSAPTAYNLLFLGSFVLGGLTAWWLLRCCGLGFLGALLGGWLWAFSHARWDEASHLQILVSLWLPAALLTFDRFLDRPNGKRGALFLLCYALQVSSGVYLTVLLHFGLGVLLLARGRAVWAALVRPRALRTILPTVALMALVTLPLTLPYASRSGELRNAAPRSQLRQHGATLSTFLAPSRHSPLARLGIFPPADRGALFLGVTATSLAAAGLAGLRRRELGRWLAAVRWRWAVLGLLLAGGALVVADRHTYGALQVTWNGSHLDYYVAAFGLLVAGLAFWRAARGLGAPFALPDERLRRFAWVAGAGALLALPLAFAVAQDLLPPLASFRVSHRSFVLALPLVGWLAGRGYERTLARLRPGALRALVGCALFGAVAWELAPRLPPWQPVPASAADFPAYTASLAAAPGLTGYVELPFDPGWSETERMHLQTRHWKPLVNGYSAVIPPSYWEIGELFDPMPGDPALVRLRELGVSHVVVHRDGEGAIIRRRIELWIAQALRTGRAEVVFDQGEIQVLKLGLPPAEGSTR